MGSFFSCFCLCLRLCRGCSHLLCLCHAYALVRTSLNHFERAEKLYAKQISVTVFAVGDLEKYFLDTWKKKTTTTTKKKEKAFPHFGGNKSLIHLLGMLPIHKNTLETSRSFQISTHTFSFVLRYSIKVICFFVSLFYCVHPISFVKKKKKKKRFINMNEH